MVLHVNSVWKYLQSRKASRICMPPYSFLYDVINQNATFERGNKSKGSLQSHHCIVSQYNPVSNHLELQSKWILKGKAKKEAGRKKKCFARLNMLTYFQTTSSSSLTGINPFLQHNKPFRSVRSLTHVSISSRKGWFSKTNPQTIKIKQCHDMQRLVFCYYDQRKIE